MTEIDDIFFSCSYKDSSSSNSIPFAYGRAFTNIGADTASQLASAGRVAGVGLSASDIAIQEILKIQNGVVAGTMSGIALSAYEKIMLEEAKRMQEMQESVPTFHINPSIHLLGVSNVVSFEPKIDEEITIKKSQWDSLQEELATKEKRINSQDEKITHLEKRVSELENNTIPRLDRKVDDSMSEFHTDMNKNMPDVHQVAKYLRGMEYHLGDPANDLE